MKLKRIDVNLLKMIYLLAAGIVVFQALGRSSLTSLLFYLTFPATALLWLRSVRRSLSASDLLMLGTIVLMAIAVLLNAGFNNAGLSFSYVKKCIIFVMTLLFFQAAGRLRADREVEAWINGIVDFLTVFLIAVYFLLPGGVYLLNGRVSNYLTFRIGNPNLTGMYLVCLYMLELYRIFTPEKWWWKAAHIIMACFMVWFCLLTRSRNSMIAMVLFTAVCVWLIFRGKRNLRISRGAALLIAVFPLVFALAYMILVETDWFNRIFGFLVEEGKKLDSRIKIWKPALEALWRSPVFGAYYEISGGTGTSQMHNSHIDIAASYGLPVLALVIGLLRGYLYRHGRVYRDKQSYIYMLGFACAIMLGIGEAALFSGGLGIYIFAGTFLLLAGRESQAEEE